MGLISTLKGLFVRPPILQVAALCTRHGAAGVEVLLVKSFDTGRWMIPKGWPIDGLTLWQAAEREAWEEGGAKGRMESRELARYASYKRRAGGLDIPSEVVVFRMTETVLLDVYPEAQQRERLFLPAAEAIAKADVPELAELIRSTCL